METIRTGIIGVGNIGTTHVKNIVQGRCPGLVLAAAADIDGVRLDFVRGAAPGAAVFSDAGEMMASGLIDAVIIAVPHYDHPKLAAEAFGRGLHVMIEKPAGVYGLQVREMNAAAARHPGLKFGIMFNQRTDPLYRRMREIVRSGELGQIRRTSWIASSWYRPQAYYDSGGWRATWAGEGGGVLLNQCPHNLDLWQWICGMPVKVLARMHFGKWHKIEVEDDVSAYVEYESGATGTFITSTGDAPGTNRFEITLDGGKLICEDGKLRIWRLEMPEPEFSAVNKSVFGSPKSSYEEIAAEGKPGMHAEILTAFADAILRGGELIARGEEGLNGLALSNAMHLSAWLGREVALPLDDGLFYEELQKRAAQSGAGAAGSSVTADTEGSY